MVFCNAIRAEKWPALFKSLNLYHCSMIKTGNVTTFIAMLIFFVADIKKIKLFTNHCKHFLYSQHNGGHMIDYIFTHVDISGRFNGRKMLTSC